MAFSLKQGKTYSNNDIKWICEEFKDNSLVKKNECFYYNIPCSLDIETSSFIQTCEQSTEKKAIMYIWQLGINGYGIIGRTYEDLLNAMNIIQNTLGLGADKILIIYIQNLSFEFQFIRKWFTWIKIFSLEERKPCYAICSYGVEFRCSYLLSGYSLTLIGKNLLKYKVEKMVGDLDYSLIRHSQTKLTDKELKYCLNDVYVVMAYIQEKIEHDGNITKIPLTKTGYVRNYCRKNCFYETSNHRDKSNSQKYHNYRLLMNSLTLELEEYTKLKKGFMGGFTHANSFYVNKKLINVGSFDFTSSYPYVMVSEKFPMSKGERVIINTLEEFRKYLLDYCCLFTVTFYKMDNITFYDNPISKSKCSNLLNFIEDNGRIAYADRLTVTITEQDFFVYQKFYKWEKLEITDFWIYKKAYLPTDFVISILKLYEDKTKLKGVDDMENEYLNSKEMINSTYGMTVTDICRDDILYDDNEWDKTLVDTFRTLQKHNKNIKRFLFYPWGIWVTAYARKNLFTGIYACGNDYVYSDTDSVKILNYDKHMDYFNKYNETVIKKLNKAFDYHKLSYELYKPKTIKGKEKILGVWDFEGVYDNFKTLGAKRYMIKKKECLVIGEGENEKKYDYSLTVSGLNKNYAIPYLLEQKKDIFDLFTDGLKIPKGKTGKMTHTYIDDEIQGNVTDYLGQTCEYYEKSCMHMENAEYTLSLSKQFIDYLKGVREYDR